MFFEFTIEVRSKEELLELHTAAIQRIELLLKAYEASEKKKFPTKELQHRVETWYGAKDSLFAQIRDAMEKYDLLQEEEMKLPTMLTQIREQTRDLFEEAGITVGARAAASASAPADEESREQPDGEPAEDGPAVDDFDLSADADVLTPEPEDFPAAEEEPVAPEPEDEPEPWDLGADAWKSEELPHFAPTPDEPQAFTLIHDGRGRGTRYRIFNARGEAVMEYALGTAKSVAEEDYDRLNHEYHRNRRGEAPPFHVIGAGNTGFVVADVRTGTLVLDEEELGVAFFLDRQSALDYALEFNIAAMGQAPADSPAEDGVPVEGPYYVEEMEKGFYQVRTKEEVRATISNIVAAERRARELNQEWAASRGSLTEKLVTSR